MKSSDLELNRIINRYLCRPAIIQGLCDGVCDKCEALRYVRRPEPEAISFYALATWKARDALALLQEKNQSNYHKSIIRNKLGEVKEFDFKELLDGKL